jgi:type II secretory pathway predicted ATPase ExeA
MSDKTDTKNHPTIKALEAHRVRLGMTDAAFHRHYLRAICSPATWSLLRSGTYTGDSAGYVEELAGPLAVLKEKAEADALKTDGGEILPLSHFAEALRAIKGCVNEPENRLVDVALPSGGGKTTLARRIGEVYGSAVVAIEASETWRHSYFTPVKAVCVALGLKTTFYGPSVAEAAMLDALRGQPRILVIDEGHYCGKEALNMIKLILNDRQASTRVVLLAIPALRDFMERGAQEEMHQLRRRRAANIRITKMSREDAELFLSRRLPGWSELPDGDRRKAVTACASAGDKFFYDTLRRICRRAAREATDTALTLGHITTAISRVEALRT